MAYSVQKVGSIERIPLLGDEARVTDDAAQFLFGGAIVAPAAETTFSSIMMLPTSLPPKRRPSWQVLRPCVTQEDCTFSMLSR